MLAGLLIVFLVGPLTVLPSYPAVILVFLLAVVLPGVVIARTLLPDLDTVVQLAVAPALAFGLMAAPGVVALEFHISLADFAVIYAMVAAGASGLAVLLSETPSITEREPLVPEEGRGSVLLGGLIIVALAGVLTTPFWAANRISGDFDDWTYASYVREYIDTDRLNAEEPFFGTGAAVNPRMRTNVWVLSQALIGDAAGVPPLDLLQKFLPPIITLFAVLVAYALSRSLFGATMVGLLAAALFLGQALIDLTPHEGLGRNIFLRISEDKMVGGYLLMPVALIFVERSVRNWSIAAFVGFVLTALALSVVHPMPLFFVATAVAVLAAFQVWTARSLAGARVPALLFTVVALASIWPLIQREQLADVVPSLYTTGETAGQFRNEFHIVELGAGLLMGSHHIILHPFMLAAILLTPLLWLTARRTVSGQLLAALTVGALLLLFVPFLATPVAKVMAPSTLWRVPWMVPVAPVIAYFAFWAVRRSATVFHAFGPSSRRLAAALAPSAVVVLALVIALVVQEQYLRWDGRAFYERASNESIVPGTGGSIFLGGVERSFTGGWRVREDEDTLLTYIDQTVPAGSTVLVGSERLSLLMPAYLTDIYPTASTARAIYPQGSEGTRKIAKQEQAFGAFYRGSLSMSELDEALERYGVDYIVLSLGTRADSTLRTFAEFDPDDFEAAAGTPDLAARDSGESQFKAWALDPDVEERLGGAQFAVPVKIAEGQGGLGFDIVVAPSSDVEGGGTVRLLLSFGEVGLPALAEAAVEVTFGSGTAAGELVRKSREIATEVIPGGRYFFTITRLADAPADTYPADVWLVGAGLKYRPPAVQEVEGTSFLIYEVQP